MAIFKERSNAIKKEIYCGFYLRTVLRRFAELGAQGAYRNTGKLVSHDCVIVAVGQPDKGYKAHGHGLRKIKVGAGERFRTGGGRFIGYQCHSSPRK